MKTGAVSKIAVSGFKSIAEEQAIAIRPLTVLAGVNSSGKSSFMQPLLLLKQTLDDVADPGVLLLNGPNVKFTRTNQIFSKTKSYSRVFNMAIELSTNNPTPNKWRTDKLGLSFHQKDGGGLELLTQTLYCNGQPVEFYSSLSSEEVKRRANIVDEYDFPFLLRLIKQQDIQDPAIRVISKRCFFALNISNDKQTAWTESDLSSQPFVDQITNLIHLPGLRGNPQRSYPKMAVGERYPGTFDNYTASIIAKWQNEKSDNLVRLANMLKHLGLTHHVKAEFLDDVQIEIQVERLPISKKKNDYVSIADVGVGVSQTLPVLVALLTAQPGQLVYIEQPEIHLHPRAQQLLADVLCETSNRGVQLVIETHSSILLRALQTLLAKGKIRKEDVAFHWVHRNKEGNTTVTTAELDDNGAYGTWPVDFDDVALETEAAYLDAIEAKDIPK